MYKTILVLAVFGAICLFPEFTEAQCAMCKSAVESNSENMSGLGDGLNKGILYLMAVPYVLFAGIVTAIVLTVRKRRREQQVS